MPIALVKADDADSNACVRHELTQGRPVAVPTETVYGLLADVKQADSVAYLRRSGPSPTTGPLAIHLGASYPVAELAGKASPLFRRLVRKAWPGPLTIILEQPPADFGPVLQNLPHAAFQEVTLPLEEGWSAVQLRCPQERWTGSFLDLMGQEGMGPLVAVGLAVGSAPAVEADEAQEAVERRNASWAGMGRCQLVVDGGRTKYAKSSTVIRVRQNRWSLVRAGVWDERTVRRLAKFTLLFVCTGNTCRSPMAAALARQALMKKSKISVDELGAFGIEIESVGVSAWEGQRASEGALAAMRRRGLDISTHRSRRLTATQVQNSDLVLVMTSGHRQEVLAAVPSASDKVRLLGEKPVPDPIGGEEEEYEAVARELETMVARVMEGLDL